MTRKADAAILHTGPGVPACPSCRESDSIEPLMRQGDVWHMRCLKCGFGFTFTQPSYAHGERRQQADRRAVARSGRRSTDLPRPIACDRCSSMDVHGWLRTGDSLWVRCQECGRVQCVAVSWGLVGLPPVVR